MTVHDLQPAARPTFYFIGVTTAKSSIMRVFPRWAEHLGLGDVPIAGIDCRHHDEPGVYRRVVEFLKQDEHSLGGLVTTHKIDLLRASRDMFDELDEYADLLGEVSSISKREGKLCGHAKDPITSGLSMEAFLPADHWRRTGGELCLLGAGGSSLALTMYIMKQKPQAEWPARIVVTNRSTPRLEEMKQIHARINPGIGVEYHHCPKPEQNDAVVNRLVPGSMVVNATGLGKDAPGSPLTDAAGFPENGLVWEFNYRGDLVFLDQARAQQQERRLTIEDGWVYFIHGWTRVIAEVFDIDIPTAGPQFDRLSEIAAGAR
ncbi:MAG: shikimate dehydrogenase [Spirochaetaceae bacterium]|nr:MAG: shikimate dehydrogenase [Spirochaetaceae bacterium]